MARFQPRHVAPRRASEPRRFTPRPKQRAFMEATEPEVLFSGAYGAGKSRVLCEKAFFLSWYYPGNRGLIVRKTFAALRHTTLKTLLDYVLPQELILDHNKTEHRILLASRDPARPSEILYGGMDDPLKFGSMELGWFGYDELIEEEDIGAWLMLLGRLRLGRVPFRQAFAATNPGAPAHWAYQRFYVEKAGRVVESNAFENAPNLPADYLARLDRFVGRYRQRYVEGLWVGYEGLVYPDYNPTVHVVEPFPIPSGWERFRSIDFGTANPFVCQWWAVDPRDDTLVCYREHYMSGRTVAEHAEVIARESAGERISYTTADHDLGDRLVLHGRGIKTVPAQKDKHGGIQAFAERLATSKITGRPRVLFFSDEARLVEKDPVLVENDKPWSTTGEFGGYIWKKGKGGPKDEPIDYNNHGMDAARYAVMSRPSAPRAKRFSVG